MGRGLLRLGDGEQVVTQPVGCRAGVTKQPVDPLVRLAGQRVRARGQDGVALRVVKQVYAAGPAALAGGMAGAVLTGELVNRLDRQAPFWALEPDVAPPVTAPTDVLAVYAGVAVMVNERLPGGVAGVAWVNVKHEMVGVDATADERFGVLLPPAADLRLVRSRVIEPVSGQRLLVGRRAGEHLKPVAAVGHSELNETRHAARPNRRCGVTLTCQPWWCVWQK